MTISLEVVAFQMQQCLAYPLHIYFQFGSGSISDAAVSNLPMLTDFQFGGGSISDAAVSNLPIAAQDRPSIKSVMRK